MTAICPLVCAGVWAVLSRRSSPRKAFFVCADDPQSPTMRWASRRLFQLKAEKAWSSSSTSCHTKSISSAFAPFASPPAIPMSLVYNAGYPAGRELPPEQELLEDIPVEILELAQHVASRGPFLVAQEVLPAMRERGSGLLPHLEQLASSCVGASAGPDSRSTTRES